ncbi:MAG: hypothetical protein AUI14_22095 [Actinobacteria bacterium 13_2_20CM_2_71_6]|nr:MAG: hypothetical protein AUI14_22095 [Actinobacteria bacterium 13_2_20CM_2_71_6]
MNEPDLGLFGPGSVSWKLHDEPIMWLAGLRSVYLQALHPQAMAAVAQNSGYRHDPWGRLLRTSRYIGAVIYGTTQQAQEAGARVRRVHARLRAVDPRTGEFFRVDEPRLLRWVHVTEVESFLTTGVRAGVALTPAEIDGYYTEQLRAAELVGLDPATVPATAAEVASYYAEIRPELALTRDSADAALFLAAPPLPYRLGLTPVRLAYTAISALAVGLLPPWARRLYGLPGLPTTDLSAALSTRALRGLLAVVPRRLYEGPIYRAAMSRTAGTD